MGDVAINVLGDVEVRVGDHPLARVSRRAQRMLAVLAIRAGTATSLDQLADAAWDLERPPTAVRQVRNTIAEIRRAWAGHVERPADLLATVPGGYMLAVSPAQVDGLYFEQLLDRARCLLRDQEWVRAVEVLTDALARWRGPAMLDVHGVEAAQSRLRWDELHTAAVEERSAALVVLGGSAAAITSLNGIIDVDPYRERAVALLMLTLHSSHRSAEALRAYRRCRMRLADELGTEPGWALRALHARILDQSPFDLRSDVMRVLGHLQDGGPAREEAAAPVPPRPAPVAPGPTGWPTTPVIPVPAELPRLPRALVARHRERQLLLRWFQELPTTVVVHGATGCGSSALAISAALDAAHLFPDGQLYVDLGHRPATPEELTERLVSMSYALGVMWPREPRYALDAARMFRSGTAGKRILVVIDNAATVRDVEALMPAPTGSVVVTSRGALTDLLAHTSGRHLELSPRPGAGRVPVRATD